MESVSAQLARISDVGAVLEGRRRLAALAAYVNRKADKDAVRHAWLLTARRIGELLGPAEQTWTGKPGESTSLTGEVLPKNDRYRFRLLAAHWPVAEEMIAGRTLSQSAIIAEIARRLRADGDMPATPEADIEILHCAAADLPVAAGSADLVLTDPPYPGEYLGCWDDLAQLAKHALRPGGLLAAYSGQAFLRETLAALSGLEYVWTAAIVHDGPFFQFRRHTIQVGWKPLLIFGRPPVAIGSEWLDTLTGGRREKSYHGWQQAEAEAAHLIEAFTVPGDLVVDPFAGGGTTAAACKKLGRRFTGGDIDAGAVQRSRERVA